MTAPDSLDGTDPLLRGVGLDAQTRCAHGVAESALAFAFLDPHPVAEGHCLVIPRRHIDTLSQLHPEEGAEMFALATRICGYIRASLAPAVNLSLSDGAEAGQDIPHLHLQVIPRHREDQGTMPLPRTSASVDLQETARVLRSLERPRSH